MNIVTMRHDIASRIFVGLLSSAAHTPDANPTQAIANLIINSVSLADQLIAEVERSACEVSNE